MKSVPRRGIYLLPNLFTTLAIFSGFYAVVSAMKGAFAVSAIAIFVAMIADGIDGRVARLTRTTSEFGAQYDSLSDMVAFGVAPALAVFSWSLHTLGKLGWLISFFYAAATALRLARFNVQAESEHHDPRYFTGLPCPSAAAVVASAMWLECRYGLHTQWDAIFLACLTAAAAALMVSNLPYLSFKKLNFRGRVSFVAVLCIVLVYMGISLNPPLVLFLVFGIYMLSGIILFLRRSLHRTTTSS